MLLAVGIWRMIVLDWKGILFFLLSLILIFFRSGIIIDTDHKKLKKYNGIFFIRKGKWEEISQLTGLQIVKTKETQTMSVLSISRTATNDIYKLSLVLPNKNIELMSGDKDYIIKTSKEISQALQTMVFN